MEQQLRQAVTDAAARPEVRQALEAVYAQLQEAIATRRPRCDASGRCCRFEAYGHRLYVTTIELAAFQHNLARLQSGGGETGSDRPGRLAVLPADGGQAARDGGGCPYQVDRLCSVHAIRPFGCRVFFCDPTATEWQNDQYEHFHGRLKALHESLAVPYFYVEWRAALRALGLSQTQVQL